jgi:alkanesulfonate monooxygenase SsuD/methylene tetrahydromethanopterin reductase-like flavin-dependent oxidoreductase (luciferase family)
MTFGGLRQVAERHQQASTWHGLRPGRLMCSYFIHFADTMAEEQAARVRQIRYFKECALAALPGDPRTPPPSYGYFVDMVERLGKLRPQDLTENSVLLGSPAQIADTLKKVEAAGFDGSFSASMSV